MDILSASKYDAGNAIGWPGWPNIDHHRRQRQTPRASSFRGSGAGSKLAIPVALCRPALRLSMMRFF